MPGVLNYSMAQIQKNGGFGGGAQQRQPHQACVIDGPENEANEDTFLILGNFCDGAESR